MTPSTDHIERETLLKAPRQRVWQAIGDVQESGRWSMLHEFAITRLRSFVRGQGSLGPPLPAVVPVAVAREPLGHRGRQAGECQEETAGAISDARYRELRARFEVLWRSPGAADHQSEMDAIIVLMDLDETRRQPR